MNHPTLKSLQAKLLLLALGLISYSCHSVNNPSIAASATNEQTVTEQTVAESTVTEPIIAESTVTEPIIAEPTTVVAIQTPSEKPGLKLEDLTLEEKVAQLFVVHPEELSGVNPTVEVNDTMLARLKRCPVGGVLLFGANIKNPEQVTKFAEEFKAACKYPPFFAVDEEGGTVARIGRNENFNVERVPSMIEIGNTGDTSNAFRVGSVIADYLNDYGFNLNFAPIADIYSNPNNKVIGKRAFGTTAEAVTPMVGACSDGMHSQDVFVCLKHFPGHGDTDTDSHSSLPVVSKTWDQLLGLEIIPFRDNFDKADMIMIAHIAVPEVNEKIDGKTAPSTLSYNMMTEKLRKELGYQGIIITDALRMQAITNFFPTQGQAAVQSLKAGADLLLCPGQFLATDGTYHTVLEAVRSGEISEERVNESVQRILDLKNKMNNR